MFWTLEFMGKWAPIIGLTGAMKLRDAILKESAGEGPAEVEVPLNRPPNARVFLRIPGTDPNTFRDVFTEGLDGVIEKMGDCKTIVDLGGNVGFATVRFAGACPNAKIACVEPVAENLAQLERNVAPLTASGQVKVIHGAVWHREAELVIANPDHSNCTGFEMRESRPGDREARIPGLPLPVVFQKAGFTKVDMLKMDIEGAEEDVFKGDVSWLDAVRSMTVEFHGKSRENSGFDALMAKHGFVIQDLAHPHAKFVSRK